MGLSEREQRLLEEMERELIAGDAEFASRLRSTGSTSSSKLILGVVLLLAGVSLLVFAVMLQVPLFGVAAFAVMFIGLVIASSNLKVPELPNLTANNPDSGGNFFESRWDKRFGE
jgi:hypothetical protein